MCAGHRTQQQQQKSCVLIWGAISTAADWQHAPGTCLPCPRLAKSLTAGVIMCAWTTWSWQLLRHCGLLGVDVVQGTALCRLCNMSNPPWLHLSCCHYLCSIQQRACITQQLLQDRDTGVAEAAARMLAHWLDQDCGGDPLQLLHLLDVETYTGGQITPTLSYRNLHICSVT